MAAEQEYTYLEVSKHRKEDSLWVVIHDGVYDITSFSKHPGGFEVLFDKGGKDASEAFDDVNHTHKARGMMATYRIGKIKEGDKQVEAKEEKSVPWLLVVVLFALLAGALFILRG